VGVHLAAKHALEFELADLGLDRGQVALDLAGGGFVVLGLGEFEEFDGVADRVGRAVYLAKFAGELGAFAAEFLGLVGLLPDRRIFQFAADFLEPLFFQIVFKETPLRS
jgi:hypothetical protein